MITFQCSPKYTGKPTKPNKAITLPYKKLLAMLRDTAHGENACSLQNKSEVIMFDCFLWELSSTSGSTSFEKYSTTLKKRVGGPFFNVHSGDLSDERATRSSSTRRVLELVHSPGRHSYSRAEQKQNYKQRTNKSLRSENIAVEDNSTVLLFFRQITG